MPSPGGLRERIAATLNAAYGDGLLSDSTLAYRLDVLFDSRIVDPASLIGDLTIRSPETLRSRALSHAVAFARRWLSGVGAPSLLALDWSGTTEELLVGREPGCDVLLTHPTVSRRHARLRYRDGIWVLQDLRSTNGTLVNAERVVRCQLRPGDHLLIGEQHLLVD